MTHPTSARPVLDANTLANLSRAIRFLEKPELQNNWREAARDCAEAIRAGRKAVGSVGRAGRESAAAWRHHGGEDSSVD